jgi:hypothetical protein
MNTILSETDYKSVPAEQKERLHAFRMMGYCPDEKGPVLALRPQATLLNAPLLGLCWAGRLRRYRSGSL